MMLPKESIIGTSWLFGQFVVGIIAWAIFVWH